ncbi:hypothetical protein CCACVL1_27349 [Corchorus capsularis]|uniref:Uncharacterized protein n=1 Tax=Corchorus capsularis TaxID=210143 RepID=A0A1R3GAY3_COCAP|nr:hypothetical protein CCACVL1_27349 [Corchorus capsularis]
MNRCGEDDRNDKGKEKEAARSKRNPRTEGNSSVDNTGIGLVSTQ